MGFNKNSDMGGMKFFTNISSLGLEGDTATPNSVIDAMPYRSALVVASSVFTNPAWNFPDGRYTLEIISVTGGRTIISLYGKTSTEADYRMFLNNENNYPSGEWTKIISNVDFAMGTARIQTTNGEVSTSQVSFGKTFSSTPKVFCNIKTSVPSNKWINAGNISTTGFTVFADVDTTGTISVDWFAVAI